MRVLYDHQVFSLQDTGGISRYHYELARNLRTLSEVQIEILMGGNSSALSFAQLRDKSTKVTSWRTRTKPNYARYAMNEMFSSIVVPFRGKFDVYHPTLNRLIPIVRRQRVVVTQHDCTHERFPELFRNMSAYVRNKRKILARADAIICISELSKRDLLQFYSIDEQKTSVVHHGFSPFSHPDSFPAAPRVTRDPYFLYVGSRTGYKNFSLLLEAFASKTIAEQYCLVVVGGGPVSPQELEKILRLGVVRRVEFIPSATDSMLADLYRGANLFVYPSLYEGFGFPPLEAMSVGCPVLANRTSSVPEICGDAVFYFQSQDPAELSKVLLATVTDTRSLNEKRRLGYEQVKLYDWFKAARQTLKIYADVCS
jgi:glycosyltransferase involved in cell wall biosynthesis